jgi:hypothetical protein
VSGRASAQTTGRGVVVGGEGAGQGRGQQVTSHHTRLLPRAHPALTPSFCLPIRRKLCKDTCLVPGVTAHNRIHFTPTAHTHTHTSPHHPPVSSRGRAGGRAGGQPLFVPTLEGLVKDTSGWQAADMADEVGCGIVFCPCLVRLGRCTAPLAEPPPKLLHKPSPPSAPLASTAAHPRHSHPGFFTTRLQCMCAVCTVLCFSLLLRADIQPAPTQCQLLFSPSDFCALFALCVCVCVWVGVCARM